MLDLTSPLLAVTANCEDFLDTLLSPNEIVENDYSFSELKRIEVSLPQQCMPKHYFNFEVKVGTIESWGISQLNF